MAQPAQVPNTLAVPSGAPTDILGIAQFLTQLLLAINSWVALVANRLGNKDVYVQAEAVPSTPPAGNFILFMDSADNKLKCKGPSGTVTILGAP